MTKDTIIEYLKEQSAAEALLRKPAVLERIYSYFETKPESNYSGYTGTVFTMDGIEKKDLYKLLKVDKEGNITITNGEDNRQFKARPNGTAVYINSDESFLGIDEKGEYTIDKYGMDVQFNNENGDIIQRTNENIIKGKYRNFKDEGAPILNIGYYLKRSHSRESTLKKAWELNKKYICENYPLARDWFDTREKNSAISGTKPFTGNKRRDKTNETDEKIKKLEETEKESQKMILTLRADNSQKKDEIDTLKREVKDKNNQIAQLEEDISERDERISDLQTRNSDLQSRNNRLQEMLKKALDKLQQIKSSIFGRFFFTKEERRTKRLTDGNEK